MYLRKNVLSKYALVRSLSMPIVFKPPEWGLEIGKHYYFN